MGETADDGRAGQARVVVHRQEWRRWVAYAGMIAVWWAIVYHRVRTLAHDVEYQMTVLDQASTAIALVSDYYAAFNRGDWDAMLRFLTDDVAHDLNQGARETGRDAFAAFLARMDRCYSETLQDIVVLASADGTRAAAEYVVRGQYKTTDVGLPEAKGQRYVLPGGAFFSLRDGRIARVSNYYNLEDWLAQVGA